MKIATIFEMHIFMDYVTVLCVLCIVLVYCLWFVVFGPIFILVF